MTDDEYTQTMNTVAAVGRLLLALGGDLDQAMRTVEHAEAVGPILYPTSYACGGSQRLQEQRSVLRPAIAFRDACEALRPKVGAGQRPLFEG